MFEKVVISRSTTLDVIHLFLNISTQAQRLCLLGDLVVFFLTESWVTENLSAADDLTQREQTEQLDAVSGVSNHVVLNNLNLGQLQQFLRGVGVLQSLSIQLLVHSLELADGRRSKTFFLVDLFADFKDNLGPVRSLGNTAGDLLGNSGDFRRGQVEAHLGKGELVRKSHQTAAKQHCGKGFVWDFPRCSE